MAPHDYRIPRHPHMDQLIRALRQRESTRLLLLLLKLTVALPACFLGPLAISWLIYLIIVRNGYVDFPYWPLFSAATAILLPLLFRLEWRTRGRFLDDEAAALAIDHSPFYQDGPAVHSRSEWDYRSNRAVWIFYIEIFLFGPRLLFETYRQHRRHQQLVPVNRAAAARILDQLTQANQSLQTGALMRDNEPLQSFRNTLDYLQEYDWIDLSKDRTRAWLLSGTRKQLART